MKPLLLSLLPILTMTSIGCSTIKHELDSLSDDQLASYLETGAKKATEYGVKYALKKNPDKTNQIQKDGTMAIQIVRQVIVPDFTGASLGSIASSTVSLTIDRLSKQLSGTTIEPLILIAASVTGQIPFPANPTEKLSPRLQKAIAAFFLGMAEGLESALGIAPPTNTSTSGAPPPPAGPPK